MATLRAWLRRTPQPARLRVRTVDDEERTIELSADGRNKWRNAEEAIVAARAIVVECLDASGAILRAQELEHESDEASGDYDRAREEKAIGKERRELAQVLDRYGAKLTDAFRAGADAAGQSSSSLIELVQALTGHLTLAITNLHNVSVNLATYVQTHAETQGTEGPTQNQQLLATVLGAAMRQGLGASSEGGSARANGQTPNGKK